MSSITFAFLKKMASRLMFHLLPMLFRFLINLGFLLNPFRPKRPSLDRYVSFIFYFLIQFLGLFSNRDSFLGILVGFGLLSFDLWKNWYLVGLSLGGWVIWWKLYFLDDFVSICMESNMNQFYEIHVCLDLFVRFDEDKIYFFCS